MQTQNHKKAWNFIFTRPLGSRSPVQQSKAKPKPKLEHLRNLISVVLIKFRLLKDRNMIMRMQLLFI